MPEVDEFGNPVDYGTESGVTPFVDSGPGIRDPFATALEPGETMADKQAAIQGYTESPFSTRELDDLISQYGMNFGNLNVPGMSPLTEDRIQWNLGQGWPGVPNDYFPDRQGGSQNFFDPKQVAPPKFLSKIYSFGQGENIGQLTERAKLGVKDWLSGGPNAPRILTPKEWNDLLPSEQEGTLGFLEYIGIYPDDYMAMIKKQQDSVMEAFGIPFQYRPARQR